MTVMELYLVCLELLYHRYLLFVCFSPKLSHIFSVLQAEFEWDGDPRRGLGDYRIPKTLLTRLDGSRIPVNSIAPYKGILRYFSYIRFFLFSIH